MNDGLIGNAGTPGTNPVKRIVRSSISMLATAPSGTYTLSPPVNPDRTELRNLGFSSSGTGDSVRIALAADGSAVTANRENATAIAANNVTQTFELTERY